MDKKNASFIKMKADNFFTILKDFTFHQRISKTVTMDLKEVTDNKKIEKKKMKCGFVKTESWIELDIGMFRFYSRMFFKSEIHNISIRTKEEKSEYDAIAFWSESNNYEPIVFFSNGDFMEFNLFKKEYDIELIGSQIKLDILMQIRKYSALKESERDTEFKEDKETIKCLLIQTESGEELNENLFGFNAKEFLASGEGVVVFESKGNDYDPIVFLKNGEVLKFEDFKLNYNIDWANVIVDFDKIRREDFNPLL